MKRGPYKPRAVLTPEAERLRTLRRFRTLANNKTECAAIKAERIRQAVEWVEAFNERCEARSSLYWEDS